MLFQPCFLIKSRSCLYISSSFINMFFVFSFLEFPSLFFVPVWDVFERIRCIKCFDLFFLLTWFVSALQKISHIWICYRLQIGCNYAWCAFVLFIFRMVSSQNYCVMMLCNHKTLYLSELDYFMWQTLVQSGKLTGRSLESPSCYNRKCTKLCTIYCTWI